MAYQDYFESEIKKIAQFLLNSISQLTQVTSQDEKYKSVHEISKDIKEKYDIDIYKIKELTNEEFIQHILAKRGFNYMNMDYLARLISLVADSESGKLHKKEYLEKSLALYLHVDKSQKTYSQERKKKIEEIQNKLNS